MALANRVRAGILGIFGLLAACSRPEQPSESVGVTRQAVVPAESKKLSVSLPTGIAVTNATAAASRTLLLADRSRVQSSGGALMPIYNSGAITGGQTELGVESRSGTILSKPAVTLKDRARVEGDVQSGGNVTPQNQTVVTGTISINNAPAFDRWSWTVNFPASSQNVSVPPDGSTTLTPGSFENVTVFSRATLRLRTGTYYLKSFDLEPQAQILVDTTEGPVYLYVRSGLIWRGATNFTGPSDRLLVGYTGTDSVAIESPFFATLVAPDATLRLAVGATSHMGAFFAKDLQLDPDVRLTFRPFSGWNDIQFDVTPRFECVQTAPNGTKAATFGYFNPNARAVSVPVGAENKFSPLPVDRRQPSAFLSGSRSNNFSVAYTGTAPTWLLNGTTASIDATKTCSTSFEVPAIKDATLSSTSPLANFGSASTLEVSSTKQAVVAFDRKAILTARGQGRFIKRARLELGLSSGVSDIEVHPLRVDWQELGATFQCKNDQDASASGSKCQALDRWNLVKAPGTYVNPYDPDATSIGAASAGRVSIDVTEDLVEMLSRGRVAAGWVLQSRASASSVLSSREGTVPPRLVLETVTFTDGDFAGVDPFSVVVDTTLATNATLPAFADGQPRRLATLKPAGQPSVRFVENELIVSTDSSSELAAIAARWNATEIASAKQQIPGLPKAHVLRIDTTRANEAALVPQMRETVNAASGMQRVSSLASMRLLSAIADEFARGTTVGVNWLGVGQEVDRPGFTANAFIDGPAFNPADIETSSNVYDWDHFAMHGVIDAWALLFFNNKMKPEIDVAIIDAGYSSEYLDPPHAEVVNCASGECENPFDCSNDNPCPWHGVHVADAGFGEPNNQYGGAGPAGAVTDLNLVWGFNDHASMLIEIPLLLVGGEDIINSSAAIPVPDWLSWTTIPAEQLLWVARETGTLFYAASGNHNTNVDARQCYDLLLGEVCPWEETNWFPCETDGVACIGATNYSTRDRASYSNHGNSVRYWASGAILTGADPANQIGNAYTISYGTSYASPFMAGTAAMTWAADPDQSAGEVESCLAAARSQGPNGRFVSTHNAVACALDYPANLSPLVEITTPVGDTETYSAVGTIRLSARADDFESGVLNTISWTSDVEGNLGTTVTGGDLLYTPSGPGNRTITARAFDPQGNPGTDTVLLSFLPAPPALQIAAPAAGEKVYLSVPQDLIGRVTNFRKLGQSPPCGSAFWTGYFGNSIIFNQLLGCSTQWSFINQGEGKVDFTMIVDGVAGKTSRSFTVVQDLNLRIKITSPLKSWPEGAAEPRVFLVDDDVVTLSAASNHDLGITAPVSYQWEVSRVDAAGAKVVLATPTGTPPTYTVAGFACGFTNITIKAMGVDALGEMDDDEVEAQVFTVCEPG